MKLCLLNYGLFFVLADVNSLWMELKISNAKQVEKGR